MQVEIAMGQTSMSYPGISLIPIVLGDARDERVFLLLQIEGKNEGIDHLRDEVVNILTHAILDADGGVYERLESSLKELNGLLKGFFLSEVVRDIHAIIGVLTQDNILHLSHAGRAEAYLIRDGAASQITEYVRGKASSSFTHIVTGDLEAGDHVVVSTQRLLRSLTPAQLTKIIQRGGDVLSSIIHTLEGEKESAVLAHLVVQGRNEPRRLDDQIEKSSLRSHVALQAGSMVSGVSSAIKNAVNSSEITTKIRGVPSKACSAISHYVSVFFSIITNLQKDLSNPQRKRRAHFLLLAGAIGAFIVVWIAIQLLVTGQRSQTQSQFEALLEQITSDISIAENRQLGGDPDSANLILKRAEERARQILSNESGLFRSDALKLLERITAKREEINKVVQVLPTTLANLSAKNPDVKAEGFVSVSKGEFLVYDNKDLYRVALNSVDLLEQLDAGDRFLRSANFPRFQSTVFLTSGNSLSEFANGQLTTMKTEDAAGWLTGKDIETYLRYLYVLVPEKKQIFKYERLSGRYGPPIEYNVSGDISGALDMTIAGPVYILRNSADAKTDAAQAEPEVIKLFRGEKQSFVIRNLPPDAMKGVTRILKSSPTGNFYFLDPVNKRVVVTTNDGDLGDSLYLKQYVLNADQIGVLQDIAVDQDDTRMYLLDDHKIYVLELSGK